MTIPKVPIGSGPLGPRANLLGLEYEPPRERVVRKVLARPSKQKQPKPPIVHETPATGPSRGRRVLGKAPAPYEPTSDQPEKEIALPPIPSAKPTIEVLVFETPENP